MPIIYDDSNLTRLYKEMEPKHRKKVLVRAFRKCATKVRKIAVSNLRASGINHAGQLSSGIRAIVFKKDAGFRVTAASKQANRKTGKGEKGMHINRRGLKKPVLAWAETGTKWRKVKSGKRFKIKVGSKWVTAGRHRGFMKRYGFIAKTKSQTEKTITRDLHNEVINSLKDVAKKYGCT